MESTISEIQVENKDEKRSAEIRPQDERQEVKTSVLCFKRRKKAVKGLKPKPGTEATKAAGAADQPQPRGGAWASFKRLVTRRADSSKQQKPLEIQVQPEINTEDVDLSKKKPKSRLKIPCMKFSRSEKRSSHSRIIDDSDCSVQVQGEAESLDTKIQTPLKEQVTRAKSTQDLSERVSLKPSAEQGEANVSNSIVSPGEEVVSVELGLDTEPSAIHTETLILEKDTEVSQEKESVQDEPASAPEIPETGHQLPEVSDIPPLSAIPDEQTLEEASNSILESEPNENRELVAEECKTNDTEVSASESVTKENELNVEKPKSGESKRMEPIAIIITDTEISEFDVKISKNVPKQFLISIENEEIGIFANDSDFEGRTSEQYETLLIETASSLVKNAIQLSIEQLVNEMVSDDTTINNLLQ
ncbi:A-kinase anchor protein 5 [Rhynchocyon petersi]